MSSMMMMMSRRDFAYYPGIESSVCFALSGVERFSRR